MVDLVACDYCGEKTSIHWHIEATQLARRECCGCSCALRQRSSARRVRGSMLPRYEESGAEAWLTSTT